MKKSIDSPPSSPEDSNVILPPVQISRHVMDMNYRLEKLTVKLLESENSRKLVLEENKRLNAKIEMVGKLEKTVNSLENQLSQVQEKPCENCAVLKNQIDTMISDNNSALISAIEEKETELCLLRNKVVELEHSLEREEVKRSSLEKEYMSVDAELHQVKVSQHFKDDRVYKDPQGNVISGSAYIDSLLFDNTNLSKQNIKYLEELEVERRKVKDFDRTSDAVLSDMRDSHKAEISMLKTQIEALRSSSDRAESALQTALKDVQFEKERYANLDSSFENNKRKLSMLEGQLRDMPTQNQDLIRINIELNGLVDSLKKDVNREVSAKQKALEDVEYYKGLVLERESDLNAYLSVFNRNKSQVERNMRSLLSGGSNYAESSVLNYLQDDDEDDSMIDSILHNKRRNRGIAAKDRNGNEFKMPAQPSTIPVQIREFSTLEIAAAQSLAAVLLNELREQGIALSAVPSQQFISGLSNSVGNIDGKTSSKPLLPISLQKKVSNQAEIPDKVSISSHSSRNVKTACSKAALAVIHTVVAKAMAFNNKIFDNDSVIRSSVTALQPFEKMLSDKDVLAGIINDTMAGLTTIDESNSIKREVAQLKVVIHDLTEKENSIVREINEKERILYELSSNCDEAERKLFAVTQEHDSLTTKANLMKGDVIKLESEKHAVLRETEGVKNDLRLIKDTVSREELGLNELRQRIGDMTSEVQMLNDKVLKSKDAVHIEETRLRQVKSESLEQLHALQLNVNRLAADYQDKQMIVDDMHRARKSLEDELDARKQEVDRQITYVTKDIEDKTRKLAGLKNDIRAASLELENIVNQKRQIQGEINMSNETLMIEINKLNAEQEQYKHLIEHYDRLSKEGERKYKSLRDKNLSLENEQSNLKQSVEDLRRQQLEFENMMSGRRRVHEDELGQIQQQVQAAIRLNKQTAASTEQKRADLDAVITELRSYERRIEEIKRIHKDMDGSVDHLKDSLRTLESEREKRQKDVNSLKLEEDSCYKQIQMLHVQIESENRFLEDCKRRCSQSNTEETLLRENENSLKLTVSNLKCQSEDLRREVDDYSIAIERLKREQTELQAKCSKLEVVAIKNDEQSRSLKDLVIDEERKRTSATHELQKINEEIMKAQKNLSVVQRKVSEEDRRVDDAKRKVNEQQIQCTQLQDQIENLNSIIKDEKANVESVKSEYYEKFKELKSLKDECKAIEIDIHTSQMAISAEQVELKHLQSIKENLTEETLRLRQTMQLELSKAEKVEANYRDVESKLRHLRVELTNTEIAYERVRGLNFEEEKRLFDCRNSLREAVDELRELEGTITSVNKDMFDERRRIMDELYHLGSVKQSAQTHFFTVSEANKRLAIHPGIDNVRKVLSPKIPTVSTARVGNLGELRAPVEPKKKLVVDEVENKHSNVGMTDRNLETEIRRLREQTSAILQQD